MVMATEHYGIKEESQWGNHMKVREPMPKYTSFDGFSLKKLMSFQSLHVSRK